MWPHVACFMPTCGRAHMLPAALHCFLDQDYPGPATLYILDDSPMPWDPCCTEATGREVVSIWDGGGPPCNTATKRNRLAKLALDEHGDDDEGLVFALWDDDDHHGPQRLRHQVEALRERPGAELSLLNSWLLYETRRHLAVRAVGLDADGTSVFTQAYLDRARWDETADAYSGGIRLNVQYAQAPELIVRCGEPADYVVVRHGANHTGEPSASYRGAAWRAPCPVSADELASLLRTAAVCRSPR